jgi:hypothetical protein
MRFVVRINDNVVGLLSTAATQLAITVSIAGSNAVGNQAGISVKR